MEPIPSYEALSPRLTAQLRRGVRTNCFYTAPQLRAWIGAGALFARDVPGGLLLLTRRPGHFRLNFYLTDLTQPLPPLPAPTVAEIPFRARDAALQEAAAYLQEQGFTPLLRRVRLKRPALTPPAAVSLRAPGPDVAGPVMAFLADCFSPLTGCLPTLDELSDELAQGRILVREDTAGLAGLVHFSFDGRAGEIRHLAVRPDLRGRGLSGELIAAFLTAADGASSTVWTGRDNTAALRAYHAAGFAPDGWESAVLVKEH